MTQLELATSRGNLAWKLVIAWFVATSIASVVFLVFCVDFVLPVFATERLLIVHLFAAFPISFLLLSKSKRFIERFRFSLVVLVVSTLSLLCSMPILAGVLNSLDANYAARWIIRSCLAICFSSTLLLPPAMLFRWEVGRNWKWTLAVWTALPCVYGLKQSEQTLADFTATCSSMRLVKTSQLLDRLIEISGHTMVQGKTTVQWQRSLRRQIKETESTVAKPISVNATLPDSLQEAMLLLSLSRATEALSLLDGLKSSETEVQLLAAIAARELEDWARVELSCRNIIATQSRTTSDPTPYQMLGESLIHRRKIGEALECFHVAINACPHAIGEFELRIGSLLSESGDHAGAISHFDIARKADPNLAEEGTRRIAAMRNNSCQLSSR